MKKGKWNEAEAILDSLQDDIVVTDRHGIIMKVSDTTGSIYGVKSDVLIGRSVYELEREGLFTPLATPLVLEEKRKVTFVQTTDKGKRLLVTGVPVFNETGEIYKVVSYSHDITELMEMKNYMESLEGEMARVKSELEILRNRFTHPGGIIAKSSKMEQVLKTSIQVASVDANVLLLGDSGVGKSMLANFIHQKSHRKTGPFIEVNCGSIPEQLFEAEFFGYEGGAFTGANRKGKLGMVELAEGGTLFLDEVGELPMEQQVKVLKLIQEKQFYRVGGTKPRKVNFRLIAATNKDLLKAVHERIFRKDLYFRLNVVPITIPSLHERQEDILPLINHFLDRFSEKYNLKRTIDAQAMNLLIHHEWDGNVRELMNIIERLVVTSGSTVITQEHLPQSIQRVNEPYDSQGKGTLNVILNEVEESILRKARKRYRTTTQIAEALGISQPTVVRKLKKYDIK
ncbi:sigma-54 interaction domain-containing protein [Pseudalkalibacillus sp. SCS-8]|uniref:sigma-54 interaction domain-containing protein n=1 Tax=Pseudalkalibacillus nanhaiensis TaxID=3115291 RepID=UPI0032D9F593